MGNLIADLKNQIKKSGANKGKIIYFKSGVKTRVRFLHELDDGMKVLFHDSFEQGVNVPCQELFGRDCNYCEREDLRHRDQYIWSVWDHEAKEVKLLMGAVNQFSPIPALVGMYEAYGTMVDRDYVITRSGTQTNTSYAVVPMDKAKFKNKDAKPFSEQKVLKILDKAYPADSEDEDKPPKGKRKGHNKPKPYDDDDDELESDIDELDGETQDYEEMSAKELYKLCKERKIKVKPKKDEEYYIEKLEEWDEENGDDNDDDEW